MYKTHLTEEQQQKFKEFYEKGYSARYIFDLLGQNYSKYGVSKATSRMRYWRKKLALPKRGVGFKSIRIPLSDEDKYNALSKQIIQLTCKITKSKRIIEWHQKKMEKLNILVDNLKKEKRNLLKKSWKTIYNKHPNE